MTTSSSHQLGKRESGRSRRTWWSRRSSVQLSSEPRLPARSSDGIASVTLWQLTSRASGADLKTAQELLRHANSRITLDVYTRAISETKRDANNKVMEMVLEAGKSKAPSPAPSQREPLMLEGSKKGSENSQHPRGLNLSLWGSHKLLYLLGLWRGRRGSNPRPLP
jgi:hypothetical protein